MGVEINPAVLEWAIERSGKDRSVIEKGLNLTAWLNQDERPSLRDLEKLAKRTYAPVGYLCSKIVPTEPLPIKDFRQLPNKTLIKPKANLLDLIYECQMRQSWYKWYREREEFSKLDLVGKYDTNYNPSMAAKEVSHEFAFPSNPVDFNKYVTLIEERDILVMTSGVAKGNTHRPVELEDARGFALVDAQAPVILVNAQDSTNARKFTLMHELGHIVSGNEGISNSIMESNTGKNFTVEDWCNKFAAEILVPEKAFHNLYKSINTSSAPFNELKALSKHFKVSTLVIMRRIYDLGYYKESKTTFWQEFQQEKERIMKEMQTIKQKPSGGGDYYNVALTRASRKFCDYLVISTLEGETTYTNAMALMNITKPTIFNTLAKKIGHL